MVRKSSLKAQERDNLLAKAVIRIKSGLYKSSYAATKALGLRTYTVQTRLNGGQTRKEARQQQQLLTKNQEQTLLKWIKELTASGYAPSYQILREVVDEVRLNKCRVFQPQLQHLQQQQQQQPQTQQLQPKGSGLQPFQPQTVIRAATLPTTDVVVVERPHTPIEHDIFEKVFLNSSPPDFQTLHKANTVLCTTISRSSALNTPIKRYINKLADETERLNTRNTLRKRETDNLRLIIQKRRTQNKGKRAVLKGQFHISTEELQSQVIEAEAATATATASQRPRTTPRPINEATIEEIDEESEEEPSEDDIDELGW
ncbi:hypothetical protein V501_00818 [Pseudogymnoascus sp. VKM F-4519 (FW-2642)]|nr:hypothetical protein V501_00818 [Pseudogymnoascus sp. VKM F-4519 (FW-2642)]